MVEDYDAHYLQVLRAVDRWAGSGAWHRKPTAGSRL